MNATDEKQEEVRALIEAGNSTLDGLGVVMQETVNAIRNGCGPFDTAPLVAFDQDLTTKAVGFQSSASGTVSIVSPSDNTASIAVAVNTRYPYAVKRINSSGTTVTVDKITLLYPDLS
jgi:hypothetical protein